MSLLHTACEYHCCMLFCIMMAHSTVCVRTVRCVSSAASVPVSHCNHHAVAVAAFFSAISHFITTGLNIESGIEDRLVGQFAILIGVAYATALIALGQRTMDERKRQRCTLSGLPPQHPAAASPTVSQGGLIYRLG